MRLKEILFNIFYLNKQERNGVFVLLLILSFLFLVKLFAFDLFKNKTPIIINSNEPVYTQDIKSTDREDVKTSSSINETKSQNLFVFNPNLISEEDALKLGFSKKLAKTLINFRNKGGKFYKADDLKKLYGINDALFAKLEPYILIEQRRNSKPDSVQFTKQNFIEKNKPTKQIIELNQADSLQLVSIRGIGPAFSKRIMKYRTMIGGFHNIEQLKEVYGMTDSLYQFIAPQVKVDPNQLVKIPINAIDFTSLRKHFYFNFQTAQAVINYRNKHGKLTENDIRNLGVFSEEKLKLILPYLNY